MSEFRVTGPSTTNKLPSLFDSKCSDIDWEQVGNIFSSSETLPHEKNLSTTASS